jgi:2-polyprenyl-3-methyl-5-hydroxy-6-metoxy-1,4-benzoquinol methylase
MVKVPQVTFVPDRVEYLKDLCRDRSILHLGFADAIHFTAALEEGRHLHAELRKVGRSGEVYGLDMEADKVRYFRDLWDDDCLLIGDVENLDNVSLDATFDLVVAGELIEHLSNPGQMLRGVRRFMRADTRLIITTPNALGLKFQLHALARNDRSHVDHCVMFSFSTLETLLRRHELRPQRWLTSMEIFEGRRNQLTRPVLQQVFERVPHLAETLVVEAGLVRE